MAKEGMVNSLEKLGTMQEGRVATGIRGFDIMTEGGYKCESINLVTGGPGSGKTVFCAQFIYNGITLYNENGIYISFDLQRQSFFSDMASLGWDFLKLEQEGRFTFVEYNPSQLQQMLNEGGGLLDSLMNKAIAKRLVIDPISSFLMMSTTDFKKREQLLSFFKMLRKWQVTTLLSNEAPPLSGKEHLGLTLHFETDSIVQMHYLSDSLKADRIRLLEVYKMRGTKHASRAVPFMIGQNGIMMGQ